MVFYVDVQPFFNQPFDQFQIPALGGKMQDRFIAVVFYVDVQSFFNQPFDQFQIPASGGGIQNRPANAVFCIY